MVYNLSVACVNKKKNRDLRGLFHYPVATSNFRFFFESGAV